VKQVMLRNAIRCALLAGMAVAIGQKDGGCERTSARRDCGRIYSA
jgi:hypothetical protein